MKKSNSLASSLTCGILAIGLAFTASSAMANTIYTYSVDGTAASDGRAQEATAVFDFSSSTTLALTLTNDLISSDWGISSSLTEIEFVLDGVPTTATLGTVSAAGALDCTAGTADCVDTTATAPYDWTLTGNGTYSLAAGGGSWKPYGIVNESAVGNTDGMSNEQHNDWLVGPVTFNISLTGLTGIPTVSDVRFHFGTAAEDWQNVSAPAVLGLMSLGLLAISGSQAARRRRIGHV